MKMERLLLIAHLIFASCKAHTSYDDSEILASSSSLPGRQGLGDSYAASCQRISLQGTLLSADCKKINGDYQRTSVDVKNCPSHPIATINGNLLCMNWPMNYRHSQDAHLSCGNYNSQTTEISCITPTGEVRNQKLSGTYDKAKDCRNDVGVIVCTHPQTSGGCISGDSTILLANGQSKKIRDWTWDDSVLTVKRQPSTPGLTRSGWTPLFERINDISFENSYFITDFWSNARWYTTPGGVPFYRLTTESGGSITLTEDHLIFVQQQGQKKLINLPSADVEPGDSLIKVAPDRHLTLDKIIRKERATPNGSYGVVTGGSSTYIANGFILSSHVSWGDPEATDLRIQHEEITETLSKYGFDNLSLPISNKLEEDKAREILHTMRADLAIKYYRKQHPGKPVEFLEAIPEEIRQKISEKNGE